MIKTALLKGANTGWVTDSAECKHFDQFSSNQLPHREPTELSLAKKLVFPFPYSTIVSEPISKRTTPSASSVCLSIVTLPGDHG